MTHPSGMVRHFIICNWLECQDCDPAKPGRYCEIHQHNHLIYALVICNIRMIDFVVIIQILMFYNAILFSCHFPDVIGPDGIPFWPRPLSHAPRSRYSYRPACKDRAGSRERLHLQTRSEAHSTAIFEGNTEKLSVSRRSLPFPIYRPINALSCRFTPYPSFGPNAISYWHVFRVDRMCLSRGMRHTIW
jgi:hypothetical protein